MMRRGVCVTPQTPFWHRNASEDAQPWFQEATRLVKEAMTTTDPDVLKRKMTRLRDLYSENVPAIAIGSPYKVWGANIRLGNVPLDNTSEDIYRGWARPVYHEQIFIK